MKTHIFFILAILIFTMSACSTKEDKEISKENLPILNVSVEIPFEIKVGQTVSIEDHKFTFSEVRSDSRCPTNAQCIWSGEATIVLVPQNEEGLVFKEVSLSTKSTDAYTYLFPEKENTSQCTTNCIVSSQPYTYGYLVEFNALSPTAEVGKVIDQSEYIATLTMYLSA